MFSIEEGLNAKPTTGFFQECVGLSSRPIRGLEVHGSLEING